MSIRVYIRTIDIKKNYHDLYTNNSAFIACGLIKFLITLCQLNMIYIYFSGSVPTAMIIYAIRVRSNLKVWGSPGWSEAVRPCSVCLSVCFPWGGRAGNTNKTSSCFHCLRRDKYRCSVVCDPFLSRVRTLPVIIQITRTVTNV